MVVLHHVIGGAPDAGLRLATDHWLQMVNEALIFLRLPLFTLLSALVYARRPIVPETASRFLGRKALVLLVPMMVLTVLHIVLRDLTVPSATPISLGYVLESWTHWYAYLWYLQALFVIFMVIGALELLKITHSRIGLLACMGLAGIAHTLNTDIPFLSISGALYLGVFFLFGLYLHRFAASDVPRSLATLWLPVLLVAGFAISHGLALTTDLLETPNRMSVFGVLYSMVLLFLVVRLRPNWPPLARLGRHSYPIFLFHIFAVSGSRIVLQALGIETLWILLPMGLLAGVVFALLVEAVAKRNGVSRFLLLGKLPKAS